MRSLVLGAMVLGLVATTSLVQAADVVVAKGKKVKFDYTLTVDNQVVETTEGKQPLEYNHGEAMLISGLEKEMEGMKVGDTKKVAVKPEEGYGAVDPQFVREYEKDKLPTDMKPEKGMVLEMQDPEGNAYPCVISEVKEKTVMLDFNHPLAGKELSFDVKIVGIEDAPVAAPAPAPAPAAAAVPASATPDAAAPVPAAPEQK